jgi:membrane-bound metal-dependent hydrolase YbcI (DUF457 family)
MSEHRQIPEPGETIYASTPSWAPAFFAIGAIGLVCGTFAAGFIFAAMIWGVIGAIFALVAFRSLVRGGIRDFYRLPRKQRVRGAALPVETISSPVPRS